MVLQGHTNMIENVDFYRKMAVYLVHLLLQFLISITNQ